MGDKKAHTPQEPAADGREQSYLSSSFVLLARLLPLYAS